MRARGPLVVLSSVCTAVAIALSAGSLQAATGFLQVSPALPVVGERVTIDLLILDAKAPSKLTVDLASPTNVRTKLRLKRVDAHVLEGSYHFADDGLWTIRIRSGAATASAQVLVLQNGAVAPGPRAVLVPGVGGLLGNLGRR